MNDHLPTLNQSRMMNRNFAPWPPSEDMIVFRPGFPGAKPGWSKWKKGKMAANKRNEARRNDKPAVAVGGGTDLGTFVGSSSNSSYKPPTLHDLQFQNRMKARRFYSKKKSNRSAPFAPRNTTSFIIRAKKSGGITSHVSPCPVTPAVLPTPIFSPSREVLVDTAKEEWGLDGYGTMNGLIRLRSPGHENREEEEDDGSSESDVEEHVEVERRLDHDLSRFEMVYPNFGDDHAHLLENRVDDQDAHIAQLEEENLTLKERLFLMEDEMADLRRRLQLLESENHQDKVVVVEEEENGEEASENEGGGDICSEKSVCD